MAGSSHVLYCIFLLTLFHIRWQDLGLFEADPLLLLYGVVLGIGSMAVSSLLCRVAIAVVGQLAPGKAPGDLKNWLAMARAGWLRHHLKTLEIVPLPLAFLLISVQIAAEEIVFRGVLINFYLPFGPAVALAASVTFFTIMQAFHMPSLQSAMFPVIGALVMGLVHGLLYLAVPVLLPLIVAHIVFFAIAVL